MKQTNRSRVLIIGAGYAGLYAALGLSHRAPDADITLINASDHLVERIRLHQVAAGQPPQSHPISRLLFGTRVKFLQGWVTALDPREKRVSAQTAAGPLELPYDKLVYALGSMTDTARVPGAAKYATTLEGASQLAQTLPSIAERGGKLIIVGGGLTTIEAASELGAAYPTLRIELITSGQIGDDLAPAGQEHVRAVLTRRATLHEGIKVSQVTAQSVIADDGAEFPFDACLWTTGFTVPKLARDAGLRTNERDQIILDSYLRSVSHPDIYAAGDSASPEIPVRISCATAIPMGVQAADNLVAELRGAEPEVFRFGYVFRCISLGRHDGVVQFVEPDDRPTHRVLTGKAAAIFKEMICRYVVRVMYFERRAPRIYWWPRPDAAQTTHPAYSRS